MYRLLFVVWLLAGWACQPTPSRPPARPHILFAIADDASPHFGAYGTRWVTTPHFDRLAAQGLLFTHAYTPNAKCAPSRACLLTGRNSWQLGAAGNHLAYWPAEYGTFVEALGATGYVTGYTGKGWGPGDPGTRAGARRQLTGPPFQARKTEAPTPGINNNDYAGNFAYFLDSVWTPGQPFCFWYGGYEPHRAYTYGSGTQLGGHQISEIDSVPPYWPDDTLVRQDMLDYGFEISHFDAHLGQMLDLLAARGLLDSTLVVVTSDHGMPFPRVKGNTYQDANRVPLLMHWPAGLAAPGRVIADYVSFIDLAPTLLDLAGIDDPTQLGMEPPQGQSLLPILTSAQAGQVLPERDQVLLGKERHDVGRPGDTGYPSRALIRDGYLYVRNYEPDRYPAGDPITGYLNVDGSPTKTLLLARNRQTGTPPDPYWQLSFGKRPAEELYDLARDPACVHNLMGDPAVAARAQAMAAHLEAELRTQGDPRMVGQGAVFDQYPVTSNAGFYERYLRGEAGPEETGWVNPSDFEPR